MLEALKFWWNPKQHYKDNKYLLEKWAKRIYKKCNNTCRRCGIKGVRVKNKNGDTYWRDVKIHAHHVEPKNKYPKLVYRVGNGECLCEDCHTEAKDSFHVMYGYNKGREFFNKWLKETTKTKDNTNKWLTVILYLSMGLCLAIVVAVILTLDT